MTILHGVTWKQFGSDLKREISEDHVFSGAAALGYYLTLAMFPALILMISVLPYVPVAHVDQAIMDLLRQVLPKQSGELVSGIVSNVASHRRGGLLSFSAIGTLWAATSGTYGIMQQLNITYDVKEARSFVKGRGVAVALSLICGVLVIGALSLVVLGGVIQGVDRQQLGLHLRLADVLRDTAMGDHRRGPATRLRAHLPAGSEHQTAVQVRHAWRRGRRGTADRRVAGLCVLRAELRQLLPTAPSSLGLWT
jgi:uncharacterized BrkB/YihY/UPF0761 family membrane protein